MWRLLCVLWLVGMVVVSAGCVANRPKLSADLQKEIDAPLYCENEDECRAMWERATFFVNTNAGYKLQVINDTIIQTYNPSKYSTKLAFSISKEPLGGGKYRIWTQAWCANTFRCDPNRYEAIARAKRYMRTGVK